MPRQPQQIYLGYALILGSPFGSFWQRPHQGRSPKTLRHLYGRA